MAQKTCYYELLGLERTGIDDDDIKKAYRKTALRMHPDKAHLNNITVDQATSRFQEIQEAYEVLSNPQERAWYDSHREQILSGKDLGEGGDTFTEDLNLWQYFGKSYPFDDTPGGFYSVYAELFKKIDAEEMQWQDNPKPAPVFGSSTSPWAVTGAFYSFWLNFCSERQFGHADKWRSQDGPNRQIRREMEAQNKNARTAARKEYNAEIRQLVQRIQNRDPRVKAKKEEDEAKKVAKKKMDEALKEEEKKQKIIDREEARKAELERWAALDEERRAQGETLTDSNNEEKAVYYCDACEKNFKSEKAFDSHCQSKKHKKMFQEYLSMEIAYKSDDEGTGVRAEGKESMEIAHKSDDDEEGTGVLAVESDAEEHDVDSPISSRGNNSPSASSPKNAQAKGKLSPDEANGQSSPSSASSASSDAFLGAFAARMKQRKNEQSKHADTATEEDDDDDDDDDDSPKSPKKGNNEANTESNEEKEERHNDERERGNTEESTSSHKEMESKKDEKADDAKEEENEQNEETEEIESKKKRRRNKDKARGVDTGSQQRYWKSADNAEQTLNCGKCNEVFKTRNALFAHLKKFPAHALLKEVAPADASKKGKKKGKR